MKKVIYGTLLLLLLSSTPLRAYTVSGKVYYRGTTIPVPNASIRLTESGGASNPGYTDAYGSFSIGWKDSNLVGHGMVLTASKDISSGQKSWTAESNTETKTVEISMTLEPNPSLTISTVPMRVTVPPAGPVVNPAMILANNGPVQIQHARIVMMFNPVFLNVNNVLPGAYGSGMLTWNSSPGSGLLKVEIEFMPPITIPDFPPESFFDVFFEVNVPENDVRVATVSVEEAIFTPFPLGPELTGRPSVTENLLGEPDPCKPLFLVDAQLDWQALLDADWPQANISSMTPAEWNNPEWGYKMSWDEFLQEGVPYPPTEFLPPELEVYGGGGGGGLNPEDAGLVMKWGDESLPDGGYASAWKYDYGLDPDLSNSIITITVTAPQFGPSGQINAVSLGIQDVNGNIRSWWWSCGPAPAPIPWNTPTTITIDTTRIGLAAATPPATGFMNNPAFNLTLSQFFIVDENFQWVGGQQPVPPPGQPQPGGMWNYWHNLLVTKKTSAHKGIYFKYSQKPDVIDTGQPPKINGWDELSSYNSTPMMADDWLCSDERPITDIHWWGSFIGWTQPHLPPMLPKAFHIGIWTDVPAGGQPPFSHPGTLIWENTCTNWVWNFAGYDVTPWIEGMKNEACFQFTQLLSEDEWFFQKPDDNQVYWLSIAAIYDPQATVQYPWGWKTRPHFFNDDAVRILGTADGLWPPKLGSAWGHGNPVEYPPGTSWDLAFELSTNEPKAPASADLDYSGFVDLADFAIFAAQWLKTIP